MKALEAEEATAIRFDKGNGLMQALTIEEIRSVSGGGDFLDSVGTGAGLGGLGGAVIGYVATGTLTGAATGAAGFGVLGGAFGAAFGLGFGVGTAIRTLFVKK